MKNIHKFENLGHSDLVIVLCLDLVTMHIQLLRKREMAVILNHRSYWLNTSCSHSRGICADMCKTWSFYDQAYGQQDCPQMTLDARWPHMTDNSWLFRLNGICVKWANYSHENQGNVDNGCLISMKGNHAVKLRIITWFTILPIFTTTGLEWGHIHENKIHKYGLYPCIYHIMGNQELKPLKGW